MNRIIELLQDALFCAIVIEPKGATVEYRSTQRKPEPQQLPNGDIYIPPGCHTTYFVDGKLCAIRDKSFVFLQADIIYDREIIELNNDKLDALLGSRARARITDKSFDEESNPLTTPLPVRKRR